MYEKRKKLLADIFTDRCVLQRKKPLRVFGKAQANSCVTITLVHTEENIDDLAVTAQSDETGSYEAILPPMEAATGVELTVTDGKDTVNLKDIAIGEVWLAGGQSNMEYELVNCKEWKEVCENTNTNIRFFYSPKWPYKSDNYERAYDEAAWEKADSNSEGFKHWSAVGYMFAEKIQEALGCTVGVIGCNWGGTSASAWMSREKILEHDATKKYIEEFEAGIPEGESLEKQQEKFDQYERDYCEWNNKCAELYTERPDISWDEVNEILGVCEWPGPMNNCNPYRPCGLYELMLKRIAPYTLAGFIYYQGESDDHHPESYDVLFRGLIEEWRALFKGETLPFIFTQLPGHKYVQDADWKNWCVIRENQEKVYKTMKNVGMAVLLDCGEFNEIHPPYKRKVATRLAMQALNMVYYCATAVESTGPIYRDYLTLESGAIRVYFDNVFDGFDIDDTLDFNPEEIDEKIKENTPCIFEVAGDDEVFFQAEVVGVGMDYIDLKSEEVPRALCARYAWTNYGKAVFFGGNELPVAPFRTRVTLSSRLSAVSKPR